VLGVEISCWGCNSPVGVWEKGENPKEKPAVGLWPKGVPPNMLNLGDQPVGVPPEPGKYLKLGEIKELVAAASAPAVNEGL